MYALRFIRTAIKEDKFYSCTDYVQLYDAIHQWKAVRTVEEKRTVASNDKKKKTLKEKEENLILVQNHVNLQSNHRLLLHSVLH